MNDYVKQIAEAIEATTIRSPTDFSWFGLRVSGLPKAVERTLMPKTARRYLHFVLQSKLYNNFYCRGFASSRAEEHVQIPIAQGMPSYVEELSRANTGQGYWAHGWRVHSIEKGELIVCHDGLELRARKELCLAPADSAIELGIQLSVRFPKEHLSIAPGFYLALSDVELPAADPPLVRIYFNLTPKGAIHFVGLATSMFNSEHIPFNLKVRNDPAHFRRCDSVVLYICKSDYTAVSKIIQSIYPRISSELKQRTPVFTKSLAAGIGLAENPGQRGSFGTHRCHVLAEGMIRAYEQGKHSTEERLKVVVACFSENKISLENPFLNPGSLDEYEFGVHPQIDVSHVPQADPISLQPDLHPEAYLQTASEIGWRLCREALWHHGHCNWLGFGEGEHSFHFSSTYGALDPGIYCGTSGVALFLAELYQATGEPDERRAALGAIRQALSHFHKLPVQYCLGLYAGWVGIAFAAARIGILLGDEELLECSRKLLQRCEQAHQQVSEFDLLYGKAGAVAALIILQDLLEDKSLLDFAVRLGDDLLRTCEKAEIGYSWKSSAFPSKRNLTGFSHGAAGVGYALLELFHVTGAGRFSRTAQLAYNYERYWFDVKEGNWPDFREEPGRRRSLRPLSFATLWCHGAPGIGLSRLRAYEITKDKLYKAEATAALQTTRRKVEEWLLLRNANYSLCHGLSGNAQVLTYGSEVLGREWGDDDGLTRRVANKGINTYHTQGDWPCGISAGQTPGLMLGLAGIGLFYLRLYDPSIPSILILRRESFLHKLKK